jgi:SET domain-containing protein
MIEVRPSPGKGRGLFATVDIKTGTVLSKAPVIEIIGGQVLNYSWDHGDKTYMTLGVQSLVNHDANPNCICFLDGDTDYFVSTRNIKAGEELFIDYGEEE